MTRGNNMHYYIFSNKDEKHFGREIGYQELNSFNEVR